MQDQIYNLIVRFPVAVAPSYVKVLHDPVSFSMDVSTSWTYGNIVPGQGNTNGKGTGIQDPGGGHLSHAAKEDHVNTPKYHERVNLRSIIWTQLQDLVIPTEYYYSSFYYYCCPRQCSCRSACVTILSVRLDWMD